VVAPCSERPSQHFLFLGTVLTGIGVSDYLFVAGAAGAAIIFAALGAMQLARDKLRAIRELIVAASLMNPQSLNRYSYVLNDPVNLYDPLGLYKACVHQAMTEYLARLAGLSAGIASQLGQFAGGREGGADSFRYSATNPLNAFLGFLGLGPSATIHFASEERIGSEKRKFAGYIASGVTGNSKALQRAGFLLHSIEDVHGAHKGFDLPFGHAFASIFGNDPDGLIGDPKFLNVANEVYQLLSGNPNAMLTAEQITGLMNAIFATCGAQGDAKKLTRPRTVGRGFDGRDAVWFGGGFRGNNPFWNWNIFDLLQLLFPKPPEEHLA
jgi:hypothetical protein